MGRARGLRPILHFLFPILLLALPAASAQTNSRTHLGKPYVVLISFDGFMPDYLKRIALPAFERVMRAGVTSVGMIPVYPTKTFPNHYSIVTGMYTETHGLVGNRFWDPQRGAAYRMGDTLAVWDSSWYRGEPIWATAEKQGMLAGSFFWVASEAPVGGVRPTYWKRYDGRIANERRVDSVLAWLALPAERRPHMITMYFSTVDGAGHDHGPLSPQVDSAAKRVDSALGRLLDGLARLPADVKDRAYLLHFSDHGLSETSPRWYAALDTLIDLNGVQLSEAGPLANLHIAGGAARAAMLRDSINRRMRFGRAYLRADVPEHLHYRKDPRIGDIVVVMDDHFQIGRADRPARPGATHGWDPTLPSMHAIFLASGPGIPAGKVIPSFENVEIYPYLTELLGLKPAAGIDGKAGRLRDLIGKAR